MKKTLLAVVLLTASGLTSGLFADPVPQPAFRLLDGYLEKRAQAAQYGAKAGPWVLMGTGVALGAASATAWFAGDAIADSFGVSRPSQGERMGVTVGLGIGAIVLTGIGYMLHLSPPVVDERGQYGAIYHETDPVVQESLAAARLESMSQNGKDTRLVSGWTTLAVVSFSLGMQLQDNQMNHRPWTTDLVKPWGWQSGSLISGITSLLVRSEEEQLYDEYQAVVARLVRASKD